MAIGTYHFPISFNYPFPLSYHFLYLLITSFAPFAGNITNDNIVNRSNIYRLNALFVFFYVSMLRTDPEKIYHTNLQVSFNEQVYPWKLVLKLEYVYTYLKRGSTACPRSYLFYILTYYIKWVTKKLRKFE